MRLELIACIIEIVIVPEVSKIQQAVAEAEVKKLTTDRSAIAVILLQA
jgi:hypothetical protein